PPISGRSRRFWSRIGWPSDSLASRSQTSTGSCARTGRSTKRRCRSARMRATERPVMAGLHGANPPTFVNPCDENGCAGPPPRITLVSKSDAPGHRSPRGPLGDDIRLGEKAPHVDDRFVGKVEVAIGGMRRAQDEEVA